MVETYWFDGKDTIKKNFLFNAIYLAILVPNAKAFDFQVENKKFKIKEKKYYQSCMKILMIFQKEDNIWDKKKVVKFLNDNKEKMNKLVNDKDFRKSLFIKYPVE